MEDNEPDNKEPENKAPENKEPESKESVPNDEKNFEFSLKKSVSVLFGTYPVSYLLANGYPQVNQFITIHQNVVGGDNIGGVVGPNGTTHVESIEVTTSAIGQAKDKNSRTVAENNAVAVRLDSIESVDQWFFSESSVNAQLHVLVVGFFAGNTQRFITEVREQIKGSLSSPKKDDTSSELQPFRRGETTILERTGTRIIDHEFTVESGKTHLRVVAFEKTEYQKYVLEFLGNCVDIKDIRAKFEKLLVSICQLDGIDIHLLGTPLIDLTRSQAAIGLGELAKSEYEYFLNGIIRPWARSTDPFLRFLVGWVLFALATEESNIQKVISLLTHWSKSKNIFLEWTSAAACSRIGLIDLDQTLGVVKSLVLTGHSYTLYATRISLSLLYYSSQNASKIIHSLAEWASDPDIEADKKHIFADNIATTFLFLVNDPISYDAEEVENENDVDKVEENQQKKDESKQDKKQKTTLWTMLSKLPTNEKEKLETDIATLFTFSFRHQKARIVDKSCDTLEKLLTETDAKWVGDLKAVLIKIRNNSTLGKKYIKIVLNRQSIKNKNLLSLRSLLEE